MGQILIWLMIKSVASQTDQNTVHSLVNQLKLDIHAMKCNQVTHIHQNTTANCTQSICHDHTATACPHMTHAHSFLPLNTTTHEDPHKIPDSPSSHTYTQSDMTRQPSLYTTVLSQHWSHTKQSTHNPSHSQVPPQHCPLTSAWGSAPRARWILTWRACSSAHQTWGDAGGGNPAGHGASSPGPPWRCRQTHPEIPAGHWQKSRHKGTVSNGKQEGQVLKQPTFKTNQPQVNKLHMRIMKLLFKPRLHNQSNIHTQTQMRKTQRAVMTKQLSFRSSSLLAIKHWKCHPS